MLHQKSLKAALPFLTACVLTFVIGCGGDDNSTNSDNPPVNTTVTDIDGNVYQTVTIGTQEWMAENLKVTHYRNGDPIPNIADNSWGELTTGAYCAYSDEVSNESTYGLLYNGYAVSDARNIAPEGWHVPTDAEWQELEIALGMSPEDANSTDVRGTNEGSKLAGREDLWESGSLENDADFGSSGFTATPGGLCEANRQFRFLGFRGHWWVSTDVNSVAAWLRALDCYETDIDRVQYSKRYGLSVRCVKD